MIRVIEIIFFLWIVVGLGDFLLGVCQMILGLLLFCFWAPIEVVQWSLKRLKA